MAFRQRKVKGIGYDASGAPLVNGQLSFKLKKPLGYTTTHFIIDRIFTAETDDTGYFEKMLWCDEDSLIPIDYLVMVAKDDNQAADPLHIANISLSWEDGSDKDFGQLLAESTPASDIVSVQSLANLIDARIALAGIITGGGQTPVQIPCSDRITPIPIANNIMSWPFPLDKTILGIFAYVTSPATSGTFTIRVKVNGTSILSTPITIDAGEKTSLSAVTLPALSATDFMQGDELTVDITDDADGTVSGLILTLILGDPVAPDTEAPTVPANLVATAAGSFQVDLTWNPSTDNVGVTGYIVQRATDAGFTTGLTTINLGNITSYSDTSVLGGTQYWYHVKARDAANNQSAYSTSDDATTDAFASIAPIAHTKATGVVGGGGHSSTTPAIDTTGASLLIMAVEYLATGTSDVVADSKGNTWTPLTEYTGGSGSVRLYYAANPTVGAGHTFSNTGDQYQSIEVAAFSNVKAVAPFDQESGSGSASGTTRQPGAITPSEDNCLIVTSLLFISPGGVGVPTIDSGFTVLETQTDATNFAGSLAYKVQTSAAPVNPTWSSNVAAERMATSQAVFKHA
jgi:hypothetical protein